MSNSNVCKDWRGMFWLACFSDSLDRGSFANIVTDLNNLFRMSFYPQMALDQLSFWGSSNTQNSAQLIVIPKKLMVFHFQS